MKKRFLITASAIVAVSAGVFAYLNSESKADDLFSANVEALTQWEDGDLNENIWWRERGTGTVICTTGGSRRCR